MVREFGMVMYTMLYLQQITTRTYYIAQGTLLSVMWQPGWEGVWGRMDTGICMAESLPCSPETITTLLIGYTPIQNKKLLQNAYECNLLLQIFFKIQGIIFNYLQFSKMTV